MNHLDLEGVRIKLDRAGVHLHEVNVHAGAFLTNSPFRVHRQVLEKGRKRVFSAYEVKPVPPELTAIAGDCLHNLRSALDHLANLLVLRNNGIPNHRTEFPIFWDQQAFDAALGVKLPGVRVGLSEVRAVQPYRRSNKQDPQRDILWMLHKLDIIDKHRKLFVALLAVRSAIASWGGDSPGPSIRFVNSGHVEEGMAFAEWSLSAGSRDDHDDPDFVPQIALDEGPLVKDDLSRVITLARYEVQDVVLPKFEPLFS